MVLGIAFKLDLLYGPSQHGRNPPHNDRTQNMRRVDHRRKRFRTPHLQASTAEVTWTETKEKPSGHRERVHSVRNPFCLNGDQACVQLEALVFRHSSGAAYRFLLLLLLLLFLQTNSHPDLSTQYPLLSVPINTTSRYSQFPWYTVSHGVYHTPWIEFQSSSTPPEQECQTDPRRAALAASRRDLSENVAVGVRIMLVVAYPGFT